MKLTRLIVVSASLILMVQSAAVSEEVAVEPQVRAELTALVNAWIDAEVEDDRSALEEILHEDFLSTFASGQTLDRDSYIDVIIALDSSPFTVNNESMRQFGDTVVSAASTGRGPSPSVCSQTALAFCSASRMT